MTTYGAVATLAGRPRAARAVGNIMRTAGQPGVPYHRVIAANGMLGGYGGNLSLKRALLVAEGTHRHDAARETVQRCTMAMIMRMQDVRWMALVVIVLAVAESAAAQVRSPGARAVREAIVRELEPVALKNCTLKRYGSRYDGGYLMCENLIKGVESAYSYGIATEDNWGCDVSKQFSVPIHQYDCFTPHRPSCAGGTFVFHDECVGPKKETIDGQPFDTIPHHIQANGDSGKRILLKIDVEGAEWDSLMATPDSVLERIDQMPMEMHGADEQRFLETIRKLKRTFYVVNLHYNNWACSGEVAPLLATAYQVLLVNKRLGVLDRSVRPPAPPSPLNAPDNPNRPECGPVR